MIAATCKIQHLPDLRVIGVYPGNDNDIGLFCLGAGQGQRRGPVDRDLSIGKYIRQVLVSYIGAIRDLILSPKGYPAIQLLSAAGRITGGQGQQEKRQYAPDPPIYIVGSFHVAG
jgi:hypothetical protein